MTGIKGNAVIQTTSVTPARVRLFQPTKRPTHRDKDGEWLVTAWGRCRVGGRLGQRHADLLETILYCAERRREEEDKTIKLLVDPARIRRVMGRKYSLEQVWTLLGELCGAVVEIESCHLNTTERIMGPVVAVAKYTRTETREDPWAGRERRKNPTGRSTRRLLTVRLGEAWTTLMRLDLPVYYDPTPLCRIRYGISKAIARHILTHRAEPQGGWTLDGLIAAVAGELNGDRRRKERDRVRKDALKLAAVGIGVCGGRVRREPQGVPHPPQGVPYPPRDVPHPPQRVPHPPQDPGSLQDL